MIRALVWKECREHWTVWLGMAAGSVLALATVNQLASRTAGLNRIEPLVATVVLLSWVYGLVCGGMLLAGEREDGTLPFLDTLPALRRQLWWAKCLAGLGLVLGQAAVLTALLAGFAAGQAGLVVGTALAVTVAGVIGLGWGLLFSAGSSSVLQVVGQAIGAQILAGLGLGFLLFLVQLVGRGLFISTGLIYLLLGLAEVSLTGLAFAGSRRVFCRPDRLRRLDLSGSTDDRVPHRQALRWLVWRQMRLFTLVVPLVALALGFLALANGTLLWPAATLVLGLACGVTVFGDEQASEAGRFLGDQRFPPGQVWLAKIGLRLTLALVATLVALLPSLIRAASVLEGQLGRQNLQEQVFNDLFLAALVPWDTILLLWVLHGFAVGQLCSLLFRKTLVAAVLGLGASVLAVSIWLPSLAGGGLNVWQTLGLPVACLAASRLLLPAWSTGRLVSHGTAGRLAACAALALAWIAGMLWYRVAQVPEREDRLNMASYAESLPTPEQNGAGQLIQNACENLAARLSDLHDRWPTRPLFHNRPLNYGEVHFTNQVEEVLRRGWPGGEPELADWLDLVCDAPWYRQLREAAQLPVGIVEDPRHLKVGSRLRSAEPALIAARLLAVQGLRRQSQGDAAAFVAQLRTGLALAANLDNHAVRVMRGVAWALRSDLLRGLDHWLGKLDGHPELLREVLEVLRQHEAQMPVDLGDTLKAELLMLHNTLEDLPGVVGQIDLGTPRDTRALWEGALALARQTPWERERRRRLLIQAEYDLPQGRETLPLAESFGWNLTPKGRRQGEQSLRRSLTRLRATEILVALLCYQAENSKPAATLAALVPNYLPAVPLDPFNNQPFHYRLSQGEDVAWPEDATAPRGGQGTRWVPAGQGIVWSVGPDGADGDGHSQAGSRPLQGVDEDVIYLVPRPRPR